MMLLPLLLLMPMTNDEDHNDFSVKGLLLMMLFLCSLPVAYVVVGLKPSWQVFSHRLYPTFNQCTMRTLESGNSSGLIVPGYFLKNHQKYLKERHFFFKLSTLRKIEKIKFP